MSVLLRPLALYLLLALGSLLCQTQRLLPLLLLRAAGSPDGNDVPDFSDGSLRPDLSDLPAAGIFCFHTNMRILMCTFLEVLFCRGEGADLSNTPSV